MLCDAEWRIAKGTLTIIHKRILNCPAITQVPAAGHVRLQVTNVVNATHYWARLDALRITEGKKSKIHKYAAVHAEIAIDLSMHFEL